MTRKTALPAFALRLRSSIIVMIAAATLAAQTNPNPDIGLKPYKSFHGFPSHVVLVRW